MRSISSFFLTIVSLALLMASCKSEPFRLHEGAAPSEIEIRRLDKALFETEPNELADSLIRIKDQFGPFITYFSRVIGAGEPSDDTWPNSIMNFVTDRMVNEVWVEVKKQYSDISDIESDLRASFGIYKAYFPESTIPDVYTCVTGFNNSIIVADSILGISLDRYLGADCKFYPQLGLYDYQIRKMTKANIVPDCFYSIATTEYNFSQMGYETENVLANIIHEGKLIYFTRCMTPKTPIEVIMGFTDSQMAFCKNNEGQMWNFIIENDILFSSQGMTIRKIIGDAPFTSYFSNASPGKAAVWLGYRIAEAYMQRNPAVKLGALMAESDYQKILEGAKYSPGK